MNLAFDGIHADDGMLGGVLHIGTPFPGRVLVTCRRFANACCYAIAPLVRA